MIGLTGVALPVVGAVAFGVGCASGITAGALSEWGVDSVIEDKKQETTESKPKISRVSRNYRKKPGLRVGIGYCKESKGFRCRAMSF